MADKNKFIKTALNLIFLLIISSAVNAAIYVAGNGMPLTKVPAVEKIEKVVIDNAKFSSERKEYSDAGNIELAAKTINFLNYELFSEPSPADRPVVSITFILKTGEKIEISASENNVWWNGKKYYLKNSGEFINIINGVFYFSENAEH